MVSRCLSWPVWINDGCVNVKSGLAAVVVVVPVPFRV